MNVSYAEALKRGWIKPEDVPKSERGGASTVRKGLSAGARAAEADAPAPRLWAAVQHLPGAQNEFAGAIIGRKFKLDVAFPEQKLCVEVDGWEWHGKHKGDFQRDRERQNLLTLNGWRILRFSASNVRNDLAGCVAQVRQALGMEPLDPPAATHLALLAALNDRQVAAGQAVVRKSVKLRNKTAGPR